MRKLLLPLMLGTLFIPSGFAQAQIVTEFGPIIPAECRCREVAVQDMDITVSSAPDYGCVLQVVQNVMNIAINLGIVLFVLALSYAGFLLIVSLTNPGLRSKARKLVLNVVLGLVIMLTSWLIVDFVMKTFAGETTGGFGPWNSILADTGRNRCLIPTSPRAITQGELDLREEVSSSPDANNGTGGSVGGEQGRTGMNIQRAVAHLQSNALPRSNKQCAKYVRQAFEAGGLSTAGRPNSAADYNEFLNRAGFRQIYSGTYSAASENLGSLQAGDVAVFERVPGHPHGHIAMYDGRQWISDFRQARMSSNARNYQGGQFAIYRP